MHKVNLSGKLTLCIASLKHNKALYILCLLIRGRRAILIGKRIAGIQTPNKHHKYANDSDIGKLPPARLTPVMQAARCDSNRRDKER